MASKPTTPGPDLARKTIKIAPIKVARIIGRLNVGGPARQACFLHQSLPNNFQTVLITGRLNAGEGDMSYLLRTQQGVYWVSSMSRPVRFFSDLVSAWRIFRILRRERPDIVHTHTAKAGAVGRVAALLAGVPRIVHTYHGNVFRGYFGPAVTRAYIQIERLLNRFTSRVIAISESQARELGVEYKVAATGKIRIIRTGFDLPPSPNDDLRRQARAALNIADRDFIVLWAGRFVPIKNVGLLVDVIARAREEAPELRFLVAGDGAERSKFDQLQPASNFTLLGWQNDLSNYYAACDAVLLTSINEGTPAILVEGMAAARPFVTTNVGGIEDLAAGPVTSTETGSRQAQNGFLVPGNADASAILSCLKQLAQSPELRKTMGGAGRDLVISRHSSQRLRQDIESLYLELMADA